MFFIQEKMNLKKSLTETIDKNNKAIDYIGELLQKTNDSLAYNPDDGIAKYSKENLAYTKFCLMYVR